MPYLGITKAVKPCAICKKSMPEGTKVYFDPTKSQGNHLAHKDCYETLVASRDRKPFDKKKKAALSSEELDPPF